LSIALDDYFPTDRGAANVNSTNQNDQVRYGIGAVAKLTGLTDHTIRVWERRYSAVVAARAPNGRRKYSGADIEKLGLLKRLTDEGLAISQIAGDSITQLREKVSGLSEFAQSTVPDRIRVGALGDFLPGLLSLHRQTLAPIEVVVSDNQRERFQADSRSLSIDVLLMESPTLDKNTIQTLESIMDGARAARGVLLYHFGSSADVKLARGKGIVVIRAPADAEEIRSAVIRSYTESSRRPVRSHAVVQRTASPEWPVTGPVPARQFSHRQLANLATISSTLECECPKHLAQLVSDLTAFEIYSDNCANRDDDDAALHRYLHLTTARARSLVEQALQKVADAEGLEY
jgi:hypothetical protein